MHYFSCEIGLFFAFFHVKCTETFSSFTMYIEILDLVWVGHTDETHCVRYDRGLPGHTFYGGPDMT